MMIKPTWEGSSLSQKILWQFLKVGSEVFSYYLVFRLGHSENLHSWRKLYITLQYIKLKVKTTYCRGAGNNKVGKWFWRFNHWSWNRRTIELIKLKSNKTQRAGEDTFSAGFSRQKWSTFRLLVFHGHIEFEIKFGRITNTKRCQESYLLISSWIPWLFIISHDTTFQRNFTRELSWNWKYSRLNPQF